MAVGLIINFPGVTQEQYDTVMEQLNLGGRMPPGGYLTPPDRRTKVGEWWTCGSLRKRLTPSCMRGSTRQCRMRGYRAPKSRLGRCTTRLSLLYPESSSMLSMSSG
jgi:hypothetical protein